MMRIEYSFILLAAMTLVACTTPPAASTPNPAPAVAATARAATDQVSIPSGYRKVMVNGEERYCRSDFDTGSRVQRTTLCFTAQQLKAAQQNSENFMNDAQGRFGLIPSVSGAPPGMSGTGR